MVVKTMEETAVPGDVIFAAAAKRERPVEALGEVGDGRLGWNWPRQTVVAEELMIEFVRKRVERRGACGGESRLRPHGASRRDRRGRPEERISTRRVGTWPALHVHLKSSGGAGAADSALAPIYSGADPASRNVKAMARQMC